MRNVVTAIAFIAGLIWGAVIHASLKPLHAAQVSSCAISKDYGNLRAIYPQMGFAFEASDGTVRVIAPDCTVERVIRRN